MVNFSLLASSCVLLFLLVPFGTASVSVEEEDEPATNKTAENLYRRQFIVNMTREAWQAYVQYGWANETIKPISQKAAAGEIAGRTIVVSLTTLWITGLKEEFNIAQSWIESHPVTDYFPLNKSLSVPEITSELLGSFLSAYALTGREVFKQRAVEIAELLTPTFHNQTGLTYSRLNPKTSQTQGSKSRLSAIGNQILEYEALGYLNSSYTNRSRTQFAYLNQNYSGLLPNEFPINSPTLPIQNSQTIQSSNANILFSSLLKLYILTNRTNTPALELYKRQMEYAQELGLFTRSRTGLTYVRNRVNGDGNETTWNQKMELNGCALAGMLALGADEMENNSGENASHLITHHRALAQNITHTCTTSARRTRTGLPLSHFFFSSTEDAQLLDPESYSPYLLSPEIFESYLVLYRTNRNETYRDDAWQLVKLIYKYSQTDAGFASFQNVNRVPPVLNDYQPVPFLGATLKYLYLIFADVDQLPLESWIFNAAGQPLPLLSEQH